MGFPNNETVAFLVEEATEGDYTLPTAGNEAIALQEAPALDAGTNTLENSEFSGGIDVSEPIASSPTPTLSLSHYLRGSGAPGVEPQYGKLLKGVFGDSLAPAEKTLIAASTAGDSTTTRAILKFADAVENFQGRPWLIKDALNGYNVRFTHEVSGNDAELNFNLPSGAPASGVLTGRPSKWYRPIKNHPTYSFTEYRSNEAAIQGADGLRVTSYSAEASAEELINQTFALQGLDTFYNPIELTAGDNVLDFTDSTPLARVATLDAKIYDSPDSLANAIASKMNAVSADVHTVVFNSRGADAGKFTFTSDAAPFTLDFSTGPNTANTIALKIGFTVADEAGPSPISSDSVQDYAAPVTPAFDANESPLQAVDNEIMIGTFDRYECISTRAISFALANTVNTTQDICQPSGKIGSSVNLRAPSITLTANLAKHQVEFFSALKGSTDVAAQWTFGVKESGTGNWVESRVGAFFLRQCKVSSHVLGDADGDAVVEIVLTGFGKGTAKTSAHMGLL